MEIIIITTAYLLAIVASLVSKKRQTIEWGTIVASAVSLGLSVSIALKVSALGLYQYSKFLSFDPFAALVALTVFVVGLATAAYSKGYFAEELSKNIIEFKKIKQYYVLFNLFMLAMFFAVAVTNPIMTWILIEATTLSTAFLISFYNKRSAMEAAWKYLIINSIGLLLGFFGTLIYFATTKSLNVEGLVSWEMLVANARALDPTLAKIAFIFVLVGYGTKVGFFPMHTWKPDAYSKTPTPIAALFSGALLNVAFLAILKFKMITDLSAGPLFSQKLMVLFGVASIVVASLMIFIQANYKRLLAYSSIEHAGIMALGFGFGGIGIYGAILHMIYHSLVKPILFFSVGNVFLKYSSTKIEHVRGAVLSLPTTSKIFMIGLLAATGIPPFGIFFTEVYILSAGMEKYLAAVVIAVTFLMIIFVGFLRHATRMLFGEVPSGIKTGEMNRWTTCPVIVLVILLVCLTFIMPSFVSSLINAAALQY